MHRRHSTAVVRASTPGLVLRSLLLGVASGSRASLGLAAPALAAGRGGRLPVLAVIGEVIGDKLPGTPDRTEPGSFAGRISAGAIGAALLARRGGRSAVPAALLGALGAVAGTVGGLAWRRGASPVLGSIGAAVVEDVGAVSVAAIAAR